MADLSNIPTYELLKHLSDDELKQIAGIRESVPAQETSGFVGGDVPLMEHTPQETMQNIESLGKGGLEVGGMAAGSLLGSIAGPAGTYAGGTAGYVGGKRLGNYIFGKPQDSLMQDVAMGGLYSAIGPVVEGLAPLGKSMVGRALKIPPRQANMAVRTKAVNNMIAEDLGISQRGLMKAIKNIDELDNGIKGAIDSAAQGGAVVDVSNVELKLDLLKRRFANRLNPKEYYQVIDQVKGELLTNPNVVDGKIPLDKAHELKKGIYQELDSFYTNLEKLHPKQMAVAQTENIAKAAVANSLREEILANPAVPENVAKELGREAGLLNAKKWIERAAARAGNHDIITFNDVLLGSLIKTGIPESIAVRFLRAPRVQARIGILFSQIGKKSVGKTLQYGTVGTKNLLYNQE